MGNVSFFVIFATFYKKCNLLITWKKRIDMV